MHGRNRLVAAIAFFAGLGFFLALPFALRAGADFYADDGGFGHRHLPGAIARMVRAQGACHSPLAALIALSAFLLLANTALVLIVVPAWDWIVDLPDRIHQIRSTLKPVIDFYTQAQEFIDGLVRMATRTRQLKHAAGNIVEPGSLLQMLAGSAPSVVINVVFGLLTIFFALSGWTRLRVRTIQGRGTFPDAIAIARVIQNVVDATSRYVFTITCINILLGTVVATLLAMLGMPSPIMWGGFVALPQFRALFRSDRRRRCCWRWAA